MTLLEWGNDWGPSVPRTSFPGVRRNAADATDAADAADAADSADAADAEDRLAPILVVSDAAECNNNLLLFLKEAVCALYRDAPKNYHRVSLCALRLVTLNLFVKNSTLCIGKLLGLLAALSHMCPQDDDARFEAECLKELVCIILVLVLKTADDDARGPILQSLQDLNFVGVILGFLTVHVRNLGQPSESESSLLPYIILKFVCDLIFEYLYRVENLSDGEFETLGLESDLIPTLVLNLLDLDEYNHNDDDTAGIAYEEFKLLLLFNEQFLMKSYTAPSVQNTVFAALLEQSDTGTNRILRFISMVVRYLNREELQIIKILILKFLYLIFTTSSTSRLSYLNDLKILVDIVLRDLNDMDYLGDDAEGNGNRLLTITYLKVMYPLLVFSQLAEDGYKADDTVDLLRYLILNAPTPPSESDFAKSIKQEQEEVIAKLAMRCLQIPWLKKAAKKLHLAAALSDVSVSPSSLTSSLTSTLGKTPPELHQRLLNSSQELIGATFTRAASVRSSTINDFHRITTSHNLHLGSPRHAFVQNNNNVFLAELASALDAANILNLPKEYLGDEKRAASPYSRLVRKAIVKRAPPPPPPPTNHKHRLGPPEHGPEGKAQHTTPPVPKTRLNAPLPALPASTPPPPPPPRRRR